MHGVLTVGRKGKVTSQLQLGSFKSLSNKVAETWGGYSWLKWVFIGEVWECSAVSTFNQRLKSDGTNSRNEELTDHVLWVFGTVDFASKKGVRNILFRLQVNRTWKRSDGLQELCLYWEWVNKSSEKLECLHFFSTWSGQRRQTMAMLPWKHSYPMAYE